MVWIFARKSRTRRTLDSHQIQVFRGRLEQLVKQEARREHKEASAHAPEAGAPPEDAFTAANRRPSCLPIDHFLWPIFAAVSE
jgi:hypothetical protein